MILPVARIAYWTLVAVSHCHIEAATGGMSRLVGRSTRVGRRSGRERRAGRDAALDANRTIVRRYWWLERYGRSALSKIYWRSDVGRTANRGWRGIVVRSNRNESDNTVLIVRQVDVQDGSVHKIEAVGAVNTAGAAAVAFGVADCDVLRARAERFVRPFVPLHVHISSRENGVARNYG